MQHRVISSIFALGFLVLIQVFNTVFRYMFIAMGAYVLVLMAYNYWYLKKNNLYTFWAWIRPFFFLAAMIGLYFVIPNNFFQGIFLLFVIANIFFMELRILAPSEQIIFLETLLSYFGLVMAIFGLNFYLLPKSPVTLLLAGLVTYFIARSSFDYVPQPNRSKNFFSWLLAFCVLEISWAMAFLPFHFSVIAVILFNIFYVLWILIYYYLLHNLTPKKIAFHVIFSTIIITITVLSTPWKA